MVLPAGTVLSGATVPAYGVPLTTGHSLTLSSAEPGATSALVPTSPTLAPPGSAPSSLYSGIPASLSHVPWIASLTHQGPSLKPLVSVPNLQILEHPPSTTGGSVNPFYVAQPAPLGLGDFGLGAHTYSYNTSHILGQVTFSAPPNVTDPASTGLVEPAGQPDGYVGSVYEFGIQLNTVATNISIPGSDHGFFWTQNVVNWNDTGIHFVDDTFNLTSGTQNPFVIEPGTIYSGCHTTTGTGVILFNYGGVFQCVGGTIPLSPASYPVTLQLYNNASVNAQKRTQVTYGYRITESGIGKVYTGISDTIVFNNPAAPTTAPHNHPGFSVDGFSPSPAGLFRDAEIVLVGGIGGDNSVFRSIHGAVNLEYTNSSSTPFQSVPSGYNFGGDTGETSTGIADYWTASHTLEINQGPAMLYGLWNAEPWASVASGAIHFAGSVTPSYALVFVGNTHPTLDPFGTGARDNMSWLPTTNAGTFNTYLPPLGAPWTAKYFVQGFAAGSAEKNGTPVTGTTTSYSLTLRHAPGSLNAPLYMFSNAQASSLAKNVTGSAAAPYDFNGLVVNMNFTFEHVNDYGYATFSVFMSQGVTQAIDVNNTYQGTDSPAGNFVIYDFPTGGSTGLLVPGPFNSTSAPDATSEINIYGGTGDSVTNQTLAGDGYGLEIILWGDTDASVSQVASLYQGSGVWVGDSTGTDVWDVTVLSGATGISDIGSTHTTGWDLFVVGSAGFPPSLGVSGLSSTDGTFSWIWVSAGAVGVETGADYGAGADYASYYYLPGTIGLTLNDLIVSGGSLGANISLSESTTVDSAAVTNHSVAVVTDGSSGVRVSKVAVYDGSTGVSLYHSWVVSVSHVWAWNHSVGVLVNDSWHVTVAGVLAWNHSTGIWVADSWGVNIYRVLAAHWSVGVVVDASTRVYISNVTTRFHSIGVEVIS
jgi:spore maturation protein SpmB